MTEEQYRFTTVPTAVTGEGTIGWGGDTGWGEDLDELVNVQLEDGVVRPRPPTTTLQWASQEDWDKAQARDGVIARSVGVRNAGEIALGFDPHHLPNQTDLIGYWSFDNPAGSTLTEHVNGWDATTTGNPTLGNPGVLGTNSVYYGPGENPNSYAKAPVNEHNQFTILLIGKPHSGDGSGNTGWLQAQTPQSGVSAQAGKKSIGIWGGSHDTAIWGRVTDSSGMQNIAQNEMLPQDEWSVVTLTADGSTARLYANEKLSASISYNGSILSYGEFVFGRQGDESFGGDLSLAAYWRTPLSEAHIQEIVDTLTSGSLTTAVKSP